MSEIEKLESKEDPGKKSCPGLVFRCIHSQYTYRDRKNRIIWGERTVMRQLIKESCPDCDRCGYLEDNLQEDSTEQNVDIRPRLEHGAKYRLAVVDVGYDWETGQCDSWTIAFILIED